MNSDRTRIVRRLLELGEELGAEHLVFQGDPLVGNLLRDDPFAFLLAASVDRGMAAETAWRLPRKLSSALGHLDPARIAQMTNEEMLEVLRRIEGRPRYLSAAARTLIEVGRHVVQHYGGDARNLWKGQRARTIRRRLEAIYGVGPGIAAMVVLLLDKLGEIELGPEDHAEMDPKPDVHVCRVFRRLGFAGRDPSPREVIAAARLLHPAFPGALDGPAWHVGRTWCHAEAPRCSACPLGELCPRLA